MKKRIGLGVFAVALALAAWAQSTIGTIKSVEGLVTVSDGTTITNAVAGAPVTAGTTFVTTSGGSFTLERADGCSVTLQPNQTLTLADGMSCDALKAAVKPVDDTLLAANQAFGAGGAGSLTAYGAILASMGLLGSQVLSSQ